MSRRILKWQIPIDDRDHPVGPGPAVLVAVQGAAHSGVVTVWTDESDTEGIPVQSARVYGTGQPVPPGDVHLGSCLDGSLVWHVFGSGPKVPQA
jgi:hypothetical protein